MLRYNQDISSECHAIRIKISMHFKTIETKFNKINKARGWSIPLRTIYTCQPHQSSPWLFFWTTHCQTFEKHSLSPNLNLLQFSKHLVSVSRSMATQKSSSADNWSAGWGGGSVWKKKNKEKKKKRNDGRVRCSDEQLPGGRSAGRISAGVAARGRWPRWATGPIISCGQLAGPHRHV